MIVYGHSTQITVGCTTSRVHLWLRPTNDAAVDAPDAVPVLRPRILEALLLNRAGRADLPEHGVMLAGLGGESVVVSACGLMHQEGGT